MRRYRVLVAVVILSTIATGCRTGDDAAPDESDESTDQAAADAGDGDGGGGGGGETFGDLASPCGGGDAAGATDQGVTDDAILVGTMADATATVQPGLNQELWDSAEAFVGWCNEQGGIAGRPIELTQYESKLFEVKQATIEACDREFMLVGGGAGIDGDGVEERVGCGLPDMPAFNATVAATEADLNRPPVPLPFSELSAGEAFYLAEEFPDAVAKAGQLTPNFPSAINLAIRGELAYEAAGWNFVETQLYNPAGEANWTGLVAEFRSAGVEALVYTSSSRRARRPKASTPTRRSSPSRKPMTTPRWRRTSSCSTSTPTAPNRRTSASTPCRPGSCGPPRRRPAAPTSPATA
jgi:hypothetical protein